jgi:hypothetical protein
MAQVAVKHHHLVTTGQNMLPLPLSVLQSKQAAINRLPLIIQIQYGGNNASG